MMSGLDMHFVIESMDRVTLQSTLLNVGAFAVILLVTFFWLYRRLLPKPIPGIRTMLHLPNDSLETARCM